MNQNEGLFAEDTPNGRSGCCYEETFPRLHELCPGRYSHRATPNASAEVRVCSCRCHVVGVQAMGMPTLKKLVDDLGRGVAARGGRRVRGNWKGPQHAGRFALAVGRCSEAGPAGCTDPQAHPDGP